MFTSLPTPISNDIISAYKQLHNIDQSTNVTLPESVKTKIINALNKLPEPQLVQALLATKNNDNATVCALFADIVPTDSHDDDKAINNARSILVNALALACTAQSTKPNEIIEFQSTIFNASANLRELINRKNFYERCTAIATTLLNHESRCTVKKVNRLTARNKEQLILALDTCDPDTLAYLSIADDAHFRVAYEAYKPTESQAIRTNMLTYLKSGFDNEGNFTASKLQNNQSPYEEALRILEGVSKQQTILSGSRSNIALHEKILHKASDKGIITDNDIVSQNHDLELIEVDFQNFLKDIFGLEKRQRTNPVEISPSGSTHPIYVVSPGSTAQSSLAEIVRSIAPQPKNAYTICSMICTGGHWFYIECEIPPPKQMTSVKYWDPLGTSSYTLKSVNDFLDSESKNGDLEFKLNDIDRVSMDDPNPTGVPQRWGMTCGYMSLKRFVDAHYADILQKITGEKADQRRQAIEAIHNAKDGEDAMVMQQVMHSCLRANNQEAPSHLEFLKQKDPVAWVRERREQELKSSTQASSSKSSTSSSSTSSTADTGRIVAFGELNEKPLRASLLQTLADDSFKNSTDAKIQLLYKDPNNGKNVDVFLSLTNAQQQLRIALKNGLLGITIKGPEEKDFVQIKMTDDEKGNRFDGQVGNSVEAIYRYFAILKNSAGLKVACLDLSKDSVCDGFSPQDIAVYIANDLKIKVQDKDGNELGNVDEVAKKTNGKKKTQTLKAYVDGKLEALKKTYSASVSSAPSSSSSGKSCASEALEASKTPTPSVVIPSSSPKCS